MATPMTIGSSDVKKVDCPEEDPFAVLAARDAHLAQDRSGSSNLGFSNSDLALKDFSLRLTSSAVARLRALREEEQDLDLTLRVRIRSGGCSGYRSDFSLDKVCRASDLEICQDGVRVLIDKLSACTLGSSELDFTRALIGESFTLRIAKAHSACGCGVSFGL